MQTQEGNNPKCRKRLRKLSKGLTPLKLACPNNNQSVDAIDVKILNQDAINKNLYRSALLIDFDQTFIKRHLNQYLSIFSNIANLISKFKLPHGVINNELTMEKEGLAEYLIDEVGGFNNMDVMAAKIIEHQKSGALCAIASFSSYPLVLDKIVNHLFKKNPKLHLLT